MQGRKSLRSFAGACLPSKAAGLLALHLPAAALLAASPAAAQGNDAACTPSSANRAIAMGQCRRSTLDASDPKNADGAPYEDWRLRLRAGQSVQIDMDAIASAPAEPAGAEAAADAMPDTFDTFLELRRPGVEEPITTNDDRPGSLNSRIRYTATEGGDYIVRARPLVDGLGDYSLRVGAPPPPPVALPLATGRTQGSVDAQSPESESMTGHRTRLYSFAGTAGERVHLALRSPGEMMLMELADENGTTVASASESYPPMAAEPPATEAQPGSSPPAAEPPRNIGAHIVAVLPTTGRYRLTAHLPYASEPTPFTIDVERRAAGPPRPPRPVATGQTVDGALGLESNVSPDPYGVGTTQMLNEVYLLPVRAGEVVTVTVVTDAFDPVVDAGVESPIGFAAAQSNDDDGATLNSRLVLRPTASGTIHLRVRALGSGVGPFRLGIAAGETPPPEPNPDMQSDHHH